MKRKLNDNYVPEEQLELATETPDVAFTALGLDPRILKAIVRQKFAKPTLVQSRAIPLALEGKDIVARSKTGSGKTAAYVLPILQSILKLKASPTYKKCVSALILVPRRDLANQVTKTVESFAAFCAQDIRVENLTWKEDDNVQRARLSNYPDIIVATPGRAAVHLNNSDLSLEGLTHIVIDEADLVLSYEYGQDLDDIAKAVPKGAQAFLMSATLKAEAELEKLKGLFCQNPVVLELDEEEKESGTVTQYTVKCAEDEKFLLAYTIFMLKLIKGKTIIFVGDIDRCYRLKLFLEQFGIKSCVLNSELPVNSRVHVVEQFNKNVYDIIIATDEHEVLGDEEGNGSKRRKTEQAPTDDTEPTEDATTEDAPAEPEADDEDATAKMPKKDKKGISKAKQDKDYGVARGIDFRNVACVLNFDLPTSSKSYTHRIGRTARAGKTGMALSFVVPKELYRKHKPTSIPSAEHDEEVLARITRHQEKKGNEIKPYAFDMKKLDGFRYRLGDALRAVTNGAIREARLRELRQELIKSEKLKRHFEENPDDLRHLRHDGELRAAKVQAHMRHVPEYLLPEGGKKVAQEEIGFVGFTKESQNRIRKARAIHKARGKNKQAAARKANPLQSFKAKGRK
ncbi:ATP-dependent RNA helicase DBP9 [Trichodelitschia bisporula]|uniref:ATP-dependent RNA helicase DBP9 n=1 Tax=Trichodelitschia bisporula TaxID=703511 RepID=A0A6G1HQA9_9PEZI|nr:ATP-dependent RNA helicase DBP9 [Trichodelitschia bisporula]